MNSSIISQLVLKDLRLWRKLILVFAAVGIACACLLAMLQNRIPAVAFLNLGFTLIVVPAGTLGIVLAMQTSVFEKAKSTQKFIMSLPVTAADFTLAKLLVNIPIFTVAWLAATSTAFYFAYRPGLLPPGSVPFVTMIFLGIFVAYICILCVSLLSQSLGLTVIAIAFFEILTSAYLWGVVLFLEPIRKVVSGSQIVWNSMSVVVVALQATVAIAAVAATLFLKCRRQDVV